MDIRMLLALAVMLSSPAHAGQLSAGATTADRSTPAHAVDVEGTCEAVADRIYNLCLATPDSDAGACLRERDRAYDDCIEAASDGSDEPDPPDDDVADDPPDSSDERVLVRNPARTPFNTVAKVDLGTSNQFRGSAAQVAPCTLLTNGHVVYNRKEDRFSFVNRVHPASYYDESLSPPQSVDPYGSAVPVTLATNTRYVDTGEQQYDYGAIFIASGFAGITTFMPVVFKESPNFINMAGYPTEDLPSNQTGAGQEQWRGFGDVNRYDDRVMYYEATSTGGASGGPVWSFDGSTGQRRLVGVNRAHSAQYDGIGVRMVQQNQDLVSSWVARPCASARLRRVDFPSLMRERRTLSGEAIVVREPETFGLVRPPRSLDGLTPARTVTQWIEGELYKWEEFHPARPRGAGRASEGAQAEGGPQSRFIRLLEPERRVLSRREAAVLLSASMLWLQETTPPASEREVYTPPARVRPVEPADAPRRPGALRPEAEIRGTPGE